jgi:hypothetical protein
VSQRTYYAKSHRYVGNIEVITKGEAMPTGSSPKREREYKEIKAKVKEEGRYKGREEEVAARIVNKQRAEHGETKTASHRTDSRQSTAKGSGFNSGSQGGTHAQHVAAGRQSHKNK